jgi:glyoxylase-like metal-dependent hydrolase (beta-lactamase superfamily II)
MREILPGVSHWTTYHDGIRADVSSYYLRDTGVVIDPLLPAEALDWFSKDAPPRASLLTNRHHYRHSGRLIDAFGVTVHASRPGMHEFSADQRVEPFNFGDSLPGGVVAHEVGAICPDETAFEIPSARAIVCADGVVRHPDPDGPLGFVPDYLIGDDPEAVKRDLRAAYERLLELDFDHLLLAHGLPVVGEGKQRLREFVSALGR